MSFTVEPEGILTRPVGTGASEHVSELERRVVSLVGVQSHPDDAVPIRQRSFEGLGSRRGAHVPQEAQDQLAAQTEGSLGVLVGSEETRHDRIEADAPGRVGLRIEEDLGVDDVLRAGLAEVGHGEVVEVSLGQQDAHALVVHGEERGQIVEVVGGAHLLDRAVGQLQAIAGGELELQLRLQGALDVDVQLSLGNPRDERRTLVHSSILLNPACDRLMRRLQPDAQ